MLDLYIRWKLMKRMRAWEKLKNTHFYIGSDGEITQFNSKEEN